ncbi:3-oxoacyl-ACP reductase FabG [Chelatococcus sambhunathii]|uniref:3-oxoacyl-ACP reductase FabG n=1 Tax=Chelatococcus sambhunathii TaxID=363953 RepID=A0ABU1DHG6_9HYPH|nr:3-oxoacyl-ACP reductase family protein [Chelatococcus sambhunathii]MDR4307562.1 3-oxoacyl-ACP reductase FabG [Chelatococcus sambhunathii]
MANFEIPVRLTNKKALVTGASRGIGAAIALRLAQEGADVAITYERSADKAEAVVNEIRALGRKAVAIKADSASVAEVQAAVDGAAEALGGLDILVNNAGIARGGLLQDVPLEDIDAILAVNVRAVVVGSQAALKHLPDGGRIITTGSCLGEQVQFPGISVYSMSKFAVHGFSRGLARDLGERGITVNVVAPGSTDTDMNPADGEGAATQLPFIALKRYGKPEDIAGAVAWLASPEGNYVTGTVITVDGGVNA